MQVKRIMSRDAVTIAPEAGVEEAMSLMKEYDIRHLPVVDNGRLIGLVTEGDIRGAIFPAMIEDLTMRDLMVSEPITVGPETMLEDAARIVYRHKIGCLPVVDGAGLLQGIVTVADMLGALIEVMGFISATSRMDVILPEQADALENALRIITDGGGRIIGVSLTHLGYSKPVHLFRLQKTDLDPIAARLTAAGYEVVSVL